MSISPADQRATKKGIESFSNPQVSSRIKKAMKQIQLMVTDIQTGLADEIKIVPPDAGACKREGNQPRFINVPCQPCAVPKEVEVDLAELFGEKQQGSAGGASGQHQPCATVEAKVTRAAGERNLLPGIFKSIGRDANGKPLKSPPTLEAPPTLASIAEIDEQEVSPLINRFIDASERGDQETALKMLHKAEVSNFSEQVVGLALRYAARNGCTELAKEILGKFPKKLAGDKEAALLLSYKEGHQDIALDILKDYPYRSDADLICACQATHSFGHKDFTLAILKTRYHVSDEAAKSIRQTKARESIVGQISRMLKLTDNQPSNRSFASPTQPATVAEAPGHGPLADVERKVQTENASAEELKSGVDNPAVPNRRQELATQVLSEFADAKAALPKSQNNAQEEKKGDAAGVKDEIKTNRGSVFFGVSDKAKWAIGKKEVLQDPKQNLDKYLKELENSLLGKDNVEQFRILMLVCLSDWFIPPSNEAYRTLSTQYTQVIDTICNTAIRIDEKWQKSIQYTCKSWMKRLIKLYIKTGQANIKVAKPDPSTDDLIPPLVCGLSELLNEDIIGRSDLEWDNGDVYVGQHRDSKPHGQGILICSDEEIYIGDFKDGEMDGQGIVICKSGDVYKGEFKDDEIHGLGTFLYFDGEIYEGWFKNGEKHGHGESTFSSGGIRKGKRKKGKKRGPKQASTPS